MRRLAVALVALVIAGCGGQAPPPSIAVGASGDPESALLAHLYAGALRYYGTPAHVETSADPVADLDTGDVTVVPDFTGRLLHRFDPRATVSADKPVYRMMISALPEGIAAGDYTESAADKPALAVLAGTAANWGGRDLSALVKHCAEVSIGAVAGNVPPTVLGTCRLPKVREYPDSATLFAALRSSQVNAAWTSTAAPSGPGDTDDVVVLADRTSLISAENVVPLYRRNELTERQMLALNEIAGELDTGGLADMLRQVSSGTDPGAVAATWLDAHPLGH